MKLWSRLKLLPALFGARLHSSTALSSPSRFAATNSYSVVQQQKKMAGNSNVASPQSSGMEKGPTHLVVLCHGLAGGPSDLAYLEDSLNTKSNGDVVVLNCRSNHWRTKDGVAEGGARIANEIKELVQNTSSLRRISLVGNSLGGLYARYALHLLWEADTAEHSGDKGKLAGLIPETFMTIATPHLGVRRYTYAITVPRLFHPLASVLFGRTGTDLFLSDAGMGGNEHPLLLRMGTDPLHVTPLRAFVRRRAYANYRGDFMVPLGTAAIEPEVNSSELARMRLYEALMGRSEGVIVATQITPQRELEGLPKLESMKGEAEFAMAEGLNSCGWTKILVCFGGLIPSNHNVICANSKNGVYRWMYRAGKSIMIHAANFLVGMGDEHDISPEATTPATVSAVSVGI